MTSELIRIQAVCALMRLHPAIEEKERKGPDSEGKGMENDIRRVQARVDGGSGTAAGQWRNEN